MSPVEVIRVGSMIHLCCDEGTFEIPDWMAKRLASDRKLIDAVKRACLPCITRKKKQTDEEL